MRRLLALICLMWVFAAPVSAQDSHRTAQIWDAQLSHLETLLQEGAIDDGVRATLRAEAEAVQSEATEAARTARAEVRRLEELLTALGPEPAADAGPEPANVTQRRAEISTKLSEARGVLAEAEFSRTRAGDALGALSEGQRSQLIEQLSHRGKLPLSLDTLQSALPELLRVLPAFAGLLQIGLSEAVEDFTPFQLIFYFAALAAVIFIGTRAKAWVLARFVRPERVAEPNSTQRLLSACMDGAARTLQPMSVVYVSLYFPVWFWGVDGVLAGLMQLIAVNLVIVILVIGFTRAALAPNTPAWRITPFTDDAAASLFRAVSSFITVVAVCAIIRKMPVTYGADLNALIGLIISVITAMFLVALLREQHWQFIETDTPRVGAFVGTRLRQLALILAILAPVGALTGFAAASFYLLEAIITIGVFLGLAYLVRTIAQEVLDWLLSRAQDRSSLVARMVNLTEGAAGTIKLILSVIIDIILLVALAQAIMRTLRLPAEDVDHMAIQVVQGIKIGSYTFSLVDFVLGILAFVSVWVVSRSLQWALRDRILPQTKLDSGVKNSLTTAVGYVGIILAATLSISTMGLDLSSLALVAGALSIGIGFGLQTVVGNFVAGLILLIERPIKIGDWIKVGEFEGTVKKINVRSSELETFNRANVIIPNADMISSSVTNMTHRDAIGRVDVAIGVAYDSDPRLVEKLLLQAAKSHVRTMTYPAPAVYFLGFGADSLDFEVRVYIADVGYKLGVASELRYVIFELLAEHSIQIPFRQMDMHIKSDDTQPKTMPAVNRSKRKTRRFPRRR